MKLSEYLSESNVRLTDFAKSVGVSVSVAHDWKTGRRFPRGRSLAEIERITDGAVTPNDFMQPPEVA